MIRKFHFDMSKAKREEVIVFIIIAIAILLLVFASYTAVSQPLSIPRCEIVDIKKEKWNIIDGVPTLRVTGGKLLMKKNFNGSLMTFEGDWCE